MRSLGVGYSNVGDITCMLVTSTGNVSLTSVTNIDVAFLTIKLEVNNNTEMDAQYVMLIYELRTLSLYFNPYFGYFTLD